MIEFKSGNVSLLDAQARQGLKSIGPDAEWCRRLQDMFPERDRMIGPDVDFVSQFAGEGHAQQPHGDTVERDIPATHVGQRLIQDIGLRESELQSFAGLWSRYRHAGPFISERGHLHVQVGPVAL